MEFKNRIKFLRLEKGWTQSRLAGELKKTKATVCKWEKGITTPSLETLIELAEMFDCSLDFLCGLSDVRRPEK